MAATGIYLQYQSYSIGTTERFIYDLFSSISPKWYPVNVINKSGSVISLDVYNIFEMYGQQLASSSTLIQQAYNNLFIQTVSTSSVSDGYTSFMYNNFGTLYGVDKSFLQNFESFSTSSVLMGYRQELRMLIEAFYAGSTWEGIQRAGQAFSGIAPIVTQFEIDRPGWNLTTISGSVLAEIGSYSATDNFFIGSTPFLRTGNIFPNPAGTFSVGDNYYLSYSKLGINTKIYSSNYVYGSLQTYNFVATGSTGSVEIPLNNVINNIIRADMQVTGSFLSTFVYDKPQSTSATFFFNYASGGYLYNNQPIFYGASFNSNILQLPSGYQSYDWYYDWAILKRNDAYYQTAFRSYPSSSIPYTVYFQNYDPTPVPLLPFSTGSLGLGSHYIIDASGSFRDVSGYSNNLQISTGNVPELILSRNTSMFGDLFSGSVTSYTGSTSNTMNFGSGVAFYCEMWVRGLDSYAIGNFNSLVFENQITPSGSGYIFGINGNNQTIFLTISTGSATSVSASIAPIFQEQPNRYHYLAYTWISGSVYLYLDGQIAGTGSLNVIPPNTGTGSTQLTLNVSGSSGSYVGVDEIVISSGFLDSYTALSHFNLTKPHLQHIGITSGSVQQYHQMQLIAFASGSQEIEYHQFSIRGISDRGLYIFDPKRSDLLRYPLFHHP